MRNVPEQHLATQLLQEISDGNREATAQLMPLVYEALEGIAHNHLRQERSSHTLDTSALVHEAYLKLVVQTQARWNDRAHFLAIASQAMRRILINYARKRNAEKRGGGLAAITLEEGLMGNELKPEMILALEEALERLALHSQRQAEVVTMRFFGGLKMEEIAVALGISEPTVRRDWRFARAWLNKELSI